MLDLMWGFLDEIKLFGPVQEETEKLEEKINEDDTENYYQWLSL